MATEEVFPWNHGARARVVWRDNARVCRRRCTAACRRCPVTFAKDIAPILQRSSPELPPAEWRRADVTGHL